MDIEQVKNLATLARIEISEQEVESLAQDLSSILEYVGQVNDAVSGDSEPVLGSVYNVMREDAHPHESGIYTDALLDAAPSRDGAYITVKKIL